MLCASKLLYDWRFSANQVVLAPSPSRFTTRDLLIYLFFATEGLLGDDIETIKKNTQTLIDAGKEVGLEVNTEKIKYMLLSRQQNAGQNHDMKVGNRCFGNVEQFR
jgi:hypothetical protein